MKTLTTSLDKIVEALRNISDTDYSEFDKDEPLVLDSIIRVALLVELELICDVVLDPDAVEPEDFDTLRRLDALVERARSSDA